MTPTHDPGPGDDEVVTARRDVEVVPDVGVIPAVVVAPDDGSCAEVELVAAGRDIVVDKVVVVDEIVVVDGVVDDVVVGVGSTELGATHSPLTIHGTADATGTISAVAAAAGATGKVGRRPAVAGQHNGDGTVVTAPVVACAVVPTVDVNGVPVVVAAEPVGEVVVAAN